ncbi:MAG: glycosyltransferase family 2 protein [Candidatus Bathyarchaeota archaeon]|nr:glycosyltransferase family 2 protein [Candidatus Bathyarchaeota archaeon]
MKRTIKYSIVVPLFNEEENIKPLYKSLKSELVKLPGNHEILFVDDGSNDDTFEELSKLAKKDAHVKVIRFRKNFGQTAALVAGFDHASGNNIVSIDGDMQNDPKDIRSLLNKLNEGYDVVCGWRKKRKDSLFKKKIPSIISNWVASKLYGIKIHDFGCTLRAYKKRVLENILIYGELHRYLPAIIGSKGYKVGEIIVDHNPRKFGESKYGNKRLVKGMLDLSSVYIIERYLTRPMHLFGTLGILSITAGIILGIYLSAIRLLYRISIADRPLLLLAILLIVFGAQFLVLGFLGEMFARTRLESNRRTLYDVDTILN